MRDGWNAERRRAKRSTLNYEQEEFDAEREIALERIAYEDGVVLDDLLAADMDTMRCEWERLCCAIRTTY